MRRQVHATHTKRCPTGKTRYADRECAKRARTLLAAAGPRRGKTIKRYYPCPFCAGYHLTSQEEL